MITNNHPERILLVGRETGPLAKIIKKFNPDIYIGSVDVLGNLDTREIVDSAFSVVKQKFGDLIDKPTILNEAEYLFKLSLIMLGEIDYDLLIPLAPFNLYPELLKSLSAKIDMNIIEWKKNENMSSSWKLLSYLDRKSIYSAQTLELSEINQLKQDQGVFVTKEEILWIKSNSDLNNSELHQKKGFFLPINEIHCAALFSQQQDIVLIGIQTVVQPKNQVFCWNNLEKNALIPFETAQKIIKKNIKEKIILFTKKMNFNGFFTLYFSIKDNEILPIFCNPLPDERIDLWNNKTVNTLYPLFIEPLDLTKKPVPNNLFGYKYPIYSSKVIRVPRIPKQLAGQRNIPGAYSNINFPICTIQGYSKNNDELFRNLKENIDKISEIIV